MKYFSDRSPFGRCGRKGRVTELGCVRGPLDTGGGWVARGGSGFECHAPFSLFNSSGARQNLSPQKGDQWDRKSVETNLKLTAPEESRMHVAAEVGCVDAFVLRFLTSVLFSSAFRLD